MGLLRHCEQGNLCPLSGRLLIGRAPSCTLQLEEPEVSGEHATLLWLRGSWRVRDLGSRNGTFVQGQRLEAGESKALEQGDTLGFGSADSTWELTDAGPPVALARCLETGEYRKVENGVLVLPTPSEPTWMVYANMQGDWFADGADGEVKALKTGSVLSTGQRQWRLWMPESLARTATVGIGPEVATAMFQFRVSRDEEYVDFWLEYLGKRISLEEREHHYMLLTLARARIEDVGEPEAEQGWIDRDRLLRMLGIDGNTLNVWIFRARSQLGAAGVAGAAGVVEVRRGQRRLGVQPERLEVGPLS